MNLFSLVGTLALKGHNEVTKGLNAIDKEGVKTSKSLADVGKGLTDLGKGVSVFSGLLGGAVTGLGYMALSVGKVADRLFDLKDATGMSVAALQEWDYVAKQAGTSMDAVAMGAAHLNKGIENMVKGTGPASIAIKALGLSATSLANMSSDARMDVLIEALQGVTNETERAELGTQLFGGKWKEIAPIVGLGTDELNRLREAGKALSHSLDDLNKMNELRMNVENLKSEFGFLTEQIGIAFEPVLSAVISLIGDKLIPYLQDSVIPMIQSLSEGFAALPEPIQYIIIGLTGFLIALGPIIIAVGTAISLFAKMQGIITLLAPVFAALAGVGLAPLLIIIAKIIVVVGLAYVAFQYWDEIMEAIQPVMSAVGDALRAMGLPLDYVIDKVKELVAWWEKAIAVMKFKIFGPGVVDRPLEADPNDPANQQGDPERQNPRGAPATTPPKGAPKGAPATTPKGKPATTTPAGKPSGEESTVERLRRQNAENAARREREAEERRRASNQRNFGNPDAGSGGNPQYMKNGGNQGVTNNYDLRGARFQDQKDMNNRLKRSGAGLQGGGF